MGSGKSTWGGVNNLNEVWFDYALRRLHEYGYYALRDGKTVDHLKTILLDSLQSATEFKFLNLLGVCTTNAKHTKRSQEKSPSPIK